jgi:hypothetical protein
MFVTAEGETLVALPRLFERCRDRWRDGEFSELQ